MKKIKKSLLFLSLVFIIVSYSSCSRIPKRELYNGNIMGVETRVIAEHKGDKLTKFDSEIKIPRNMIDLYLGMADSMVQGQEMDSEMSMVKLAIKSFNKFSFKIFNGIEVIVESNEKEGVIFKFIGDYNSLDLETLKSSIKSMPKEKVELIFDENNFDSFSKFEEELFKLGLNKK